MARRLFLVIFYAGYIAQAVPASAAAGDDNLATLNMLAARVGELLGAASKCSSVTKARIADVREKFFAVLASATRTKDETKNLLQSFEKNQELGALSVTQGRANCPTVESDLQGLERATSLSPKPADPATSATTSAVVLPGGQTKLADTSKPGILRGVTDTEVRFGMVAPFSGPVRDLGYQLHTGIEIAFKAQNDHGGVHGRVLKLIAADDGFEPARTAQQAVRLIDQEQIFGFIGNVGTEADAITLPLALKQHMLFFGPFTGANLVRREPPDRYVFNCRPSYAEEAAATLNYLIKVRAIKPEQIAVFAEDDASGDAAFGGVARAMRAIRGGDDGGILRLSYKRNLVEMEGALAQLKAHKTPIKAVIMMATTRAAVKFIEKTRNSYPSLIYANASIVGATNLRDELMLLGPKYATGVIVTNAMPTLNSYVGLVLDYKAALDKYASGEQPNALSFEGYVTARILIEGLARAGRQLDTEKLVDALESLKAYDLGLGALVSFSRSEHQAFHKVWGSQLNAEGKYEVLELD